MSGKRNWKQKIKALDDSFLGIYNDWAKEENYPTVTYSLLKKDLSALMFFVKNMFCTGCADVYDDMIKCTRCEVWLCKLCYPDEKLFWLKKECYCLECRDYMKKNNKHKKKKKNKNRNNRKKKNKNKK